MMILVAVTVTFTIGENGILSQAKESAKLAERAQLHEQIMGAMKLTSEGKIIVGDSYEEAKTILTMQGYEVDELQPDGTFEVTGKKGTYKYKITETEIIKGELIGAEDGDATNPGGEGNGTGSEGNVQDKVYYDITFKDLSQIDWNTLFGETYKDLYFRDDEGTVGSIEVFYDDWRKFHSLTILSKVGFNDDSVVAYEYNNETEWKEDSPRYWYWYPERIWKTNCS